MIQRYTHPRWARSGASSVATKPWLEVELAADRRDGRGRPRARRGRARAARERGAFDIGRIEEIERITQHDVIAFTTAVAEKVGPAARWLHFGLTSSDVVDTAQALQMREACDLIVKDIAGADGGGARRAPKSTGGRR